MSTFTGKTKTSASTFINGTKNPATMKLYTKGGQGYNYDSDLIYDADIDPISGNKVLYDSIGTLPVFSNEPKS